MTPPADTPAAPPADTATAPPASSQTVTLEPLEGFLIERYCSYCDGRGHVMRESLDLDALDVGASRIRQCPYCRVAPPRRVWRNDVLNFSG